jgi:hypothetical protein
MGFMNDLKKILFGAKSAAGSAMEKGKEAGEELVEKSGEFIDKTVDKVQEVGGKAMDKAKDLTSDIWEEVERTVHGSEKKAPPAPEKSTEPEPVAEEIHFDTLEDDLAPDDAGGAAKEPGAIKAAADKIGQKIDELSHRLAENESVQKAGEVAEDVGRKVLDTSEKVGKKVMEVSEDVGKELFEKGAQAKEVAEELGQELLEKAKHFGKSVFDKANELVEKAQKEAEKESMDDLVSKMKQMNEDLESKIKDKPAADIKESLLGKHDSFFDRASRYAEGNYQMEDKEGKTGDMEIGKDPEYKGKPQNEGTVPGFEDLDGDGDELIDDAIIDEDEDK